MSRETILRRSLISSLLTDAPNGSGLPVLPLIEMVLAYATPAMIVIHYPMKFHVLYSLVRTLESGERELLLIAGDDGLKSITLGSDEFETGGVSTFRGHVKVLSEFKFTSPHFVVPDPTDPSSLLVGDQTALRRIKSGKVSVVAGGGRVGFEEGIGSAVRFNQLRGIAVATGAKPAWCAVTDTFNSRIRSVELATGRVTTIGGTGDDCDKDGDFETGSLCSSYQITFDPSTEVPNSMLYFSTNSTRNCVRVLDVVKRRLSTLHFKSKVEINLLGVAFAGSRLLVTCLDSSSIYCVNTRNGDTTLVGRPGTTHTDWSAHSSMRLIGLTVSNPSHFDNSCVYVSDYSGSAVWRVGLPLDWQIPYDRPTANR